ncbi:hypothetical protein [Moorena sp. SIO3H5]|uniref:hypothetical protein n=1 Tax=Moorena sp. SIO3H5 TaxID=2607834 RepID=UPI0013B6DCC6|nr:hypothetical protein [Moorena sp. SIO3H5]NEO71783.1 hypothetical protein [Moorena sp. SIO3H5]
MDIKGINLNDIKDMKIDLTKEIKSDPNTFNYSTCKALMLDDFGAATKEESVFLSIEPSGVPVGKSVGIGFDTIK